MYCYTAGATGLTACVPPWAQAGGQPELRRRLQDPTTRTKIAGEIRTQAEGWENFYLGAGSPDRILLVGFKQAPRQEGERSASGTSRHFAAVPKFRRYWR